MSKKVSDYEWNKDPNKSILLDHENQNSMLDLLNSTGKGFCLAKWTQVTMHLGNGLTHSCHHPGAHKIPLEEIARDPGALHNTEFKKARRKEMLTGQRPKECDFCWRVEDNGEKSDRVLKSLPPFSLPHHDKISKLDGTEDVFPTYVEVSFGRTCNFKCSYCGPAFSSMWEQETKQHGVMNIQGNLYNGLLEKEKHYTNAEHNPYIEAFWKWFPEAYKHMHTFRITGGEPLLIKDTFKVIDFLINNPNPNLEFSINSNACPPGDQWKVFTAKIKELMDKKSVRRFELYTSAEATGERCEYIRDGIDWDMFVKNIHYFLDNSNNTRVVFMCAFNVLSVTTFKGMLEWVLELKKKYSSHGFFKWLEEESITRHKDGEETFKERMEKNYTTHNRIGIDIPYVRHPTFMDPSIIDINLLNKYLVPAGDYMYDNMSNSDWFLTNRFEDHECQKLRRNIIDSILHIKRADKKTGLHSDPKLKIKRARFREFVDQYDHRRGKDFLKTFPEYTKFYELCKREEESLMNMETHDPVYEVYKKKVKKKYE